MELAPAIERLKALAHLKGAGRHGELAASLLARIGPLIGKPCAGPSIQGAAELLPVYVRFPRRLKVRLAPRDPLQLVESHFSITRDRPQTADELVAGTGLKRDAVLAVLGGGRFERDGIDGENWRPKLLATHGGYRACTIPKNE